LVFESILRHGIYLVNYSDDNETAKKDCYTC
jgi:hypothetical protein